MKKEIKTFLRCNINKQLPNKRQKTDYTSIERKTKAQTKRRNIHKSQKINVQMENSVVVQWLSLGAFTARGLSLIPGQGDKIPQAAQCSQKKKKKKPK